jgi:glyoxylase-like metal-dependent hydrolase (beta-lactamase superfamily II)
MQIHTIESGRFKLDGGAMFGVVPKSIWQRNIPTDDVNLCTWAMRCVLVEDEKRLILIDTGMGDKQPEKWQAHYQPSGNELVKAIKAKGYNTSDITDVVFSHLHFDHCGGGVRWNAANDGYELTFKNAKYWTHSGHWHSAMNPNIREKATFLHENLMPIFEAEQLFFSDQHLQPFGPNLSPIYVDGHTEKMTMLKIQRKNQTFVFMADTIPSHAHLPLPYVMGYDVRPLQTMLEKELLLKEALDNQYVLIFDHDPFYDCCTVKMTEKGIRVAQTGKLEEFL